MVRLLSIGIDCFSAVLFIIPVMLILQYAVFRKLRLGKCLAAVVFASYAMAVFSAVGIPTAASWNVYGGFNLIPLVDIVNSPLEYMKNTVLNILLFLPLGFLLPAFWKRYRDVKITVITGAVLSLAVELSQIFTHRLTDVDDLITNTIGTVLGFYLWKMLPFGRQVEKSDEESGFAMQYENQGFSYPVYDGTICLRHTAMHEPAVILVLVFLIGFFLKPLVSDWIWNAVLSGAWWESIK